MTKPIYEATTFAAGDTVRWFRPDLAQLYPGGTISYVLYGPSAPVSATADALGNVVLTASQTTTMTAGRWSFTASVTVAGERATIVSGTVIVKVNPATAGVTDNRSHARRVLDAIEATLENRATESHSILILSDGRRMASVPHVELIQMRSKYTAEVAREAVAERLARGLAPRNRLLVRM